MAPLLAHSLPIRPGSLFKEETLGFTLPRAGGSPWAAKLSEWVVLCVVLCGAHHALGPALDFHCGPRLLLQGHLNGLPLSLPLSQSCKCP